MIQFLSGHFHVKPKNLLVFKDIVQEYNWELPESLKAWEDLYHRDHHVLTIAEVANRINELLPVCEEMVTDKWTVEERHQLRERCGTDVVFKLYNALGALCGESARKHQLKTVASLISQQ